MLDIRNTVGCVLSGELIPQEYKFKTHTHLGSAFVIRSRPCYALTCHHVVAELSKNDVIAFAVLNSDRELSYYRIDFSSIVRWEQNDLVCFKITTFSDEEATTLNGVNFDTRDISLAAKVSGVGIPKNHRDYSEQNKILEINAMTGFVTSSHGNIVETTQPFIVGMSGGPVVSGFPENGVCGVISGNRMIGLDQIISEETVSEKKFVYSEHIRLGKFIAAKDFVPWLQKLNFID